MGTKVEYSINLLSATSVDSNNDLSLKSVDVWENDRSKGLSNNNNNNNNKGDQIGTKRLQFSMERTVDTNNLEFIRKTMQMHEDIFKHQVEELHRVYRVQKLLMDDLKKEIKHKKLWKPINGEEGMSQLQTTRNPNGATDLDLQAHSMKEDMCSRDKSNGSCSAEDIIVTKIPTRGFDLEMPAEEGTLTGECEAGPSAYTDEEIELELTLSIGGSNNETYQKQKKKAKPHVVQLSSKLNLCGSFKSDRVGGECSDPTTPMSSSSVTFEQERKESSSSLWLSHQGLKLT